MCKINFSHARKEQCIRMKKKIAIITGASGGIGKEFVVLLLNEKIDEIWCVARNPEKLNIVKEEFGDKIVPLYFDLSEKESIISIDTILKKQQPRIKYLINSAGIGEELSSYKECTVEMNYKTIHLNCCALVSLCNICIPYMEQGDHIINLSSQSSFQPVPYLNLYASTKVFVRNYTRALNVELKEAGISATAVCSGWTETEMLPKSRNNINIKYPGIISPKRVAVKALADAKKKKDMSVCTLYVKYMHMLSKFFPTKSVMNTWVKSISKYLIGV